MITFEKCAAGAPEALRAWFYPGMDYGHEFVYPRTRARELAKLTKQPVPAMPDELEASTKMPIKPAVDPQVKALKNAPLKAEMPSGKEEEAGRVFHKPKG